MDLQHQLTFSIDSYDGLAKVFDTHVKTLALHAIEQGHFDTRIILSETYECSEKKLVELMSGFGTAFNTGNNTILVVHDEFLLRSEVIRDEGLVRFKLWVLAPHSLAETIHKRVQEIFKNYVYTKMALDIAWAILGHGGIEYIDLQTELDDIVFQEAYPYIPNLADYVTSFLDHKAPVLILHGAPGTGKTRLIKYILKAIGLRKNTIKENFCNRELVVRTDDELDLPYVAPTPKNPTIIYSMEDKIFKEDRFFVRFLSDSIDAMVLEDIDFNLGSRKDGNVFMYKLLGGSDGLISGIKRKIILSTNLRGLSNIDEALLRPGRCFDKLSTRALNREEAEVLAKKLNKDLSKITKKERNEYTLADIYNLG